LVNRDVFVIEKGVCSGLTMVGSVCIGHHGLHGIVDLKRKGIQLYTHDYKERGFINLIIIKNRIVYNLCVWNRLFTIDFHNKI